MTPVTDPALLAELNGSTPKPVTDPALLAQLNSSKVGLGDIASSAWNDIKKAGSNIASSVYSGVTLPRDVITGQAKLPSSGAVPGSVEFGDPRSAGPRVADMAALATPMPAAMRAGERVIPGVARSAVTEAAPPLTPEAVKAASTKGFNEAKNMGVDISTAPMVDMAQKIERQLWDKGIHAEHAPTIYKTLERMSAPPEGAVSTISDLHNLRQAFGNARGSITHPKDALAGSIATDTLDEFLKAIPQKDILAGDAAAASSKLTNAIDDYAAAARGSDVAARVTRAERQAAKSGSGSNIDNALRQKISAVLDVEGRPRGWNPQEIAQAEKTVRGTPAANFARKVGKLGFNDGLTMMLHTGAALGGAAPVSIPLGIAGTVSRKIAEALTQREATKLEQMILSRSPYARSQPKTISREVTGGEQARRQAIVRALMLEQQQR